MRKNALSICCFTCAAGAIGAFCRWLQNQLAFDETGLSAASAWNYIVPLVLIAAAVCFYCIVARYKRSGLEMTTDFYGTFDGSTRLFVPLAWVIGAAMLLLLGFVARSITWTWIVYGTLYVLFGIILVVQYRSKIFKKRKKK